MNSQELIESFGEFARSKNIDRPTMMSILDEVFRTMIRKKYDQDDNFDVIINPDNGDLEIWRNREIVDDNSEDIWDFDKITLTEAQKIEPDFEIGESVAEAVQLEDFGRRAVLLARQTLIQRVKDLERDLLYQQYKDQVGEIVTGEVYQVWSREALIMDKDDNELVMPKSEQIPKDRFRQGRHRAGRGTPRGSHQRGPENHPLAGRARLFGAPVRAGSARNLRRPHRHQERGARARRAGQGGRRELRRAHRPGGGLRGHEGAAASTRWCASWKMRTSTSSITPTTWSCTLPGPLSPAKGGLHENQ